MKIDLETKVTNEIDVKYICCDVGPRYWEDGDVNGEEDISYEEQEKGAKPRMPMAYKNDAAKYQDEQYRWAVKIDAETGNIVGWPEGVEADIHYKVCDDGTYWLEDTDGNEVHKIDDYVPTLWDFYDDSYGDYIIMTVEGDGHVKEWYSESKLKDRIDSFLKEEGF